MRGNESKGKVMNKILVPIQQQRGQVKSFFIRAAREEIDLAVHVHTNNIINFNKCLINLPKDLKPKLIFSIRQPRAQLRSIFKARRYSKSIIINKRNEGCQCICINNV